MATVVNIVSRCGVRIEACYINQSNKTKLALYKLLLSIQESFKTVVYNYVTTISTSEVGVVYMYQDI